MSERGTIAKWLRTVWWTRSLARAGKRGPASVMRIRTCYHIFPGVSTDESVEQAVP
jgi:hypothetical protein